MNLRTKNIAYVLFIVMAVVVTAVIARQVSAWTNPAGAPPFASPSISTTGGNVGIGTATPGAKLEVASGQAGQAGPVVGIKIDGPNSPANANSAQDILVSFASAGSTAIRSYRGGSWDTYMQFLTNSSSGGNNPQVRMTIDGAGNVGVGTASPDSNYKLTTSGGGIKAENSNATQPAGYFSNTGGGPAITVGTGGITLGGVNQTAWSSGLGGSGTTNYVGKFTAGSTVGNSQIFDNGTNIGIGIGAPLSKMHMYESTTNTGSSAGLTVEQAGTGDSVIQYLLSGVQRWTTGVDNSDSDKFKIGRGVDWASGTDVVITTAGSVGIGTTNPGFSGATVKLGVAQSDGGTGLAIANTAGVGRFALNGESDGSWSMYDFASGSWIKGIAQKSGNVGIGTASPNALLEVNGGVYIKGGNGDVVAPFTGSPDVSDVLRILQYSNRTTIPTPAQFAVADINGDGVLDDADYSGAMRVSVGTETLAQVNMSSKLIDGQLIYKDVSNSRVGIGTASPLSKLSVGGDGVANTAVYGNGSAYGVYGNATGGSGAGVYGSGSYSGVYGLSAANGVMGFSSSSGYGVYGHSAGFFGVYGSTDATIGSASGVYGIGKTGVSGESVLVTGYGVLGTSLNTDGTGVYGSGSPSSGIGAFGTGFVGVKGSGGSSDFLAAGPGVDYATLSSVRWKSNITEIDDAVQKVMGMRGVYYDWDGAHGGKRDIGFIAEEVGKQVPEIVLWDKDAPGYATGMDYGHITPVLLQAIKEQQGQIEEQKKEIANLKKAVFH